MKNFDRKKESRFSDKTIGLLNFADLKEPKYKILYWAMFAFMFVILLISSRYDSGIIYFEF